MNRAAQKSDLSSPPGGVSDAAWSPILTGPEAARANTAIDAITHDLRALDPFSFGPTVAAGAAGIALFFAYLAEVREDERAAVEAERWLDAAVDRLGDVYPPAESFLSGYTGVAWTIIQLCGEDTAEALCSAIDSNLEARLATPAKQRQYDLIVGLVGIGLYLLEAPDSPRRRAQLETVLSQLEQRAVADEGGITWFTPPEQLPDWQRKICPNGYFNLGLAHGVPGVIGLLSRMLRADVERERVSRLLQGAMHWMLGVSSCRVEGRYPSWRGRGASDAPARLAWCYGDVGVAPVMLSAARAADRPDWYAEALALSRLTTLRPPELALVRDGGLCHGAAGVAHVLNRLFHGFGEAGLRESACYWFGQLLDLRRPGTGCGGFSMFDPESDHQWRADPGVLTGAAGIGLALLSATSNQIPEWDRSLLMDV
jgi:lantibiotic modifying enzyme